VARAASPNGNRLPQGKAARQALAVPVGTDGMRLVADRFAPTAPRLLRSLPAVAVPRRVWIQPYVMIDGAIRRREPRQMPAAAAHLESPDEPEARSSTKREMGWTGDTVHRTETCDEDQPPLVTQVTTMIVPVLDCIEFPDGEAPSRLWSPR
jgi:hypothetical protein